MTPRASATRQAARRARGVRAWWNPERGEARAAAPTAEGWSGGFGERDRRGTWTVASRGRRLLPHRGRRAAAVVASSVAFAVEVRPAAGCSRGGAWVGRRRGCLDASLQV